ncbi:MAG: sialate O-acetylesterase [Paludibacteraceae bacterium]
MKTKYFLFSLILLCGLVYDVNAKVTLPKIISSNMVLQRDSKIPVWGFADAGEKVNVTFSGITLTAVADSEGRWSVVFNKQKMNSIPSEMIVEGTNRIKLVNILVGDVWLCSGQSNMEYPLDYRLKKYAAPATGSDVAVEELSKPKSDKIRYILAEKQHETNDIKSVGWITPDNAKVLANVTAVGYFFAKEVFEHTNVPIGIISTSWGGTMIEEWTPVWVYEKSSLFADQINPKDKRINGRVAGTKFDSMLRPIIPFAVKGMLWYQGETNCMTEDQAVYPEKVKLMLETYRSLFRNPKMPFYFVQISPYLYTKRNNDAKMHTEELLPEFWEAQAKCLFIPNTGMIVTTDLVDKLSDIHPSYKWEVGRRLSLIALAKDYRKNVIYEGPSCKSVKGKGNKVILSFVNAGGGLISKDNQPLTWFTLAGTDGKFLPAKAEIKGKNVIVWNDDLQKPVKVRFAWNEKARPNLFNKEGLPAVPFRISK